MSNHPFRERITIVQLILSLLDMDITQQEKSRSHYMPCLFTANEWRLHQIDNGIVKSEVSFLQSADGISLARISDAVGDVVGGHGIFLLGYLVMVELKYHSPGT
ncbi:MAG: hypothetical protein NTV68_05325 [Methanomicrobiales archaeon]|nr:hypothetical protein [Methanomicrobiales archaeon]